MMRRMEDKELAALEAVALQLQKENEDLDEWRKQWAKIDEGERKRDKQKKGGFNDRGTKRGH